MVQAMGQYFALTETPREWSRKSKNRRKSQVCIYLAQRGGVLVQDAITELHQVPVQAEQAPLKGQAEEGRVGRYGTALCCHWPSASPECHRPHSVGVMVQAMGPSSS